MHRLHPSDVFSPATLFCNFSDQKKRGKELFIEVSWRTSWLTTTVWLDGPLDCLLYFLQLWSGSIKSVKGWVDIRKMNHGRTSAENSCEHTHLHAVDHCMFFIHDSIISCYSWGLDVLKTIWEEPRRQLKLLKISISSPFSLYFLIRGKVTFLLSLFVIF